MSGYQSPRRHHHRTISISRQVKETRNARSEHVNSEDDGASQRRINQYLIQQEIGRGSFGSVHLATDQYGKEYAVKEFSKSRLRRRAKSNLLRQRQRRVAEDQLAEAEKNAFDLIKEEIAIMKKLNHENVVSLIEVLDDPEEDSLYMVLEMCKKGVVMKIDIDDTVEGYDDENCRLWFRDLVLGIEYLHAQGVIHRDIKPDNCLLTEDDTLKLVDFGVSEMFEKSSDMRIAKSAGSPAFMAPELCIVQKKGVFGKPADIWSMGVTLFCLRFGRVPFQKSNMLEMYDSIVKDGIVLPECSPELKDLFGRILEKDADKRIKMSELRTHPWVTKSGKDPLLSQEENCADPIAPVTQEDLNTAITGNMGGLIVVLKAANKFKELLERKHPELVNSILDRASRMVAPPLTMSHVYQKGSDLKGAIRNHFSRRKTDGLSGIYRQQDVDAEVDQLSDQLAQHSYDETAKGHAHDVLKDQVFVDIGQGPSGSSNFISESPPPADFSVFEKAYEEEEAARPSTSTAGSKGA